SVGSLTSARNMRGFSDLPFFVTMGRQTRWALLYAPGRRRGKSLPPDSPVSDLEMQEVMGFIPNEAELALDAHMLVTHPFDDDKLREECGIFGVYDAEGAAAMVA